MSSSQPPSIGEIPSTAATTGSPSSRNTPSTASSPSNPRSPPTDYQDDEAKEIFLAHHATYSHDPNARQAGENSWNKKTQAEKHNPATALRIAHTAEQIYADLLRATNPADDPCVLYIRANLHARVRDLQRLRNEIAAHGGLLQELEGRAREAEAAWDRIADLEVAQALASTAEAVVYADAKRIAWHDVAQPLQEEREAWEAFLKDQWPEVPRDAEGRERMPVQWYLPHDDSVEQAKAVRAVDVRDGELGLQEHRPGVRWEAWKDVSGGMSEGSLWLAFDERTGRVVDRLFRKDVYYNAKQWHKWKYFDGDLRDVSSKRDWESSCHQAMQEVPGFHGVPVLRSSHLNQDLKTARLYIEWAPHGDLAALLASYTTNQTPIPEPMLWNILETLASAAAALSRGHVGDEAAAADPRRRPRNWKPIVHRDIKPGNIFLTHPLPSARTTPHTYPYYPRPLLADFGLAFKLPSSHPETDPTNPSLWINSGTPSYMAPEQCGYTDRRTGESLNVEPLGEATNVYAIGAVMAVLMRGGAEGVVQPLWLGEGREGEAAGEGGEGEVLYSLRLPEGEDESEAGGYSRELRRIVNACLHFHPSDRPDVDQLRRWIGDAVREEGEEEVFAEDGSGGMDLACGMRSGVAAGGDGAAAREHVVWMEPDKYQLMFARDQLPGREVGVE